MGGGPGRHPIERVAAAAFELPAPAPESDGTLVWSSTTLVVVEVAASGERGLGYTTGPPAVAALVEQKLAEVAVGRDAWDVPACWKAAQDALRNAGRPGIGGKAASALDLALWDLKARLLGLPIGRLLGAVRDAVPCYGSGGFTSCDVDSLQRQLSGWVASGLRMLKMKVGREPERDPERVRAAREAVGPDAELFVDANGAYGRKQALTLAHRFAEQGVSWLEEPVPQEDLEGLRLVRDRAPVPIRVAGGEYAWDAFAFRRLLEAGAVDVLQADATRCGGLTGFLQAGALCWAWNVPLSAHTAPSLHAPLCAALPRAVHVEYFVDHARAEQTLFDGALAPLDGALHPHRARPGFGLALRRAEAERFRVWGTL